jgi:mycothiol synthase
MATNHRHADSEIDLRPARPEDADAVTALFEAASLAAVGFHHREMERVRTFWARWEPGSQGAGAQVAVAGSAIVGAGLVPPPQGRTLALVAVHPDRRGQGAGGALADWLVAHTTGLCGSPPDRRVTLTQRILASDHDALRLLRARGWRRSRTLVRMERAVTAGDRPAHAVPGIDLRPVSPEREMAALLLAEHLAFKDSEAYDPAEFALALARRRQWLATDSRYDPALWFVAAARDDAGQETIAGICLCTLDTVERADMAWINRLAVRVPWRRRGIGQALLRTAFAELAQRGKRHVGLNVVAGNLNALHVYEQAGMAVVPALQFDEVELPVCTGEEGG